MAEIKNVLANRYASKAIKDIFSEEGKVKLEREFWIAVLKAQKELGLDIPQEAIEAYEKVKDQINLDKINERDRILKHDVKARIDEFCELAGYEHIHKGMTSRDLTDNVEQFQIYRAMQVIRLKTVRALSLLAQKAFLYKDVVMAARTHNVAAQPTTFGKRLAMFGQEMIVALENFNHTISQYSLRGLKGAVGTLVDQLTLFKDSSKVKLLEDAVIRHLGFNHVLGCVGQVYPRSMDYQVIAALVQLSSGPSSLCKTLRLMAGHELASEGFSKDQVGSSAMPHKMNSRNCERVNGFSAILKGFSVMVMELSGDQWNEGDVSCSVVRRVAVPDSFYTMDGLLETFMTILKEMNLYESVIAKELDRYLPFLSTTTILMEAVKKGIGRETAHEIIKKHATQTVTDLRLGKILTNDLLQRLANDPGLPLCMEDLEELFKNPAQTAGLACEQVIDFTKQVEEWVSRFPESKNIEPGRIV